MQISPRSKVVDCEKKDIDMGSCGNACCTVDVRTRLSPLKTYEAFKAELVRGGGDGSYTYVTGPGPGGQNPGDNLTACEYMPPRRPAARVRG